MIIKKRLDIALENEEKGTDKQLVQCREGAGGIALVTGAAARRRRRAPRSRPATKRAARRAPIST